MSRQHWTDAAKDGVRKYWRTVDWARFHDEFPEFSYDAWEVKRRRVARDRGLENAEPIMVPGALGYVGPSIAFYDFETTFSTQPRMLTAAIADGFGEIEEFTLDMYPGKDWLDDRLLCIAIRDRLEKFNIICGWNSKLFDIPVLNGRLAYHHERPCVAQMHIDLMYYATGSFMRIGRKSLESVSTFFSSPNRKTPLSPHIWDLADHGDAAAYQTIREHNVADVKVTRDVFAHLIPFIRTIHRAG